MGHHLYTNRVTQNLPLIQLKPGLQVALRGMKRLLASTFLKSWRKHSGDKNYIDSADLRNLDHLNARSSPEFWASVGCNISSLFFFFFCIIYLDKHQDLQPKRETGLKDRTSGRIS